MKPVKCRACGSTELDHVVVGPGDVVGLCRLCGVVTESPEELDADSAQEELLTQLGRIRQRRGAPAAPGPVRRRSVLPSLVLLVVGVVALLWLFGRLHQQLLGGVDESVTGTSTQVPGWLPLPELSDERMTTPTSSPVRRPAQPGTVPPEEVSTDPPADQQPPAEQPPPSP